MQGAARLPENVFIQVYHQYSKARSETTNFGLPSPDDSSKQLTAAARWHFAVTWSHRRQQLLAVRITKSVTEKRQLCNCCEKPTQLNKRARNIVYLPVGGREIEWIGVLN